MHNIFATTGKPIRSRNVRRVVDVLVKFTAITVFLCAALLTGCSPRENETAGESSPPATTADITQDVDTTEPVVESVTYEVLQEKPIPAGGASRVILIDPKDSTESRLRVLGDQLHKEALSAGANAAVFVFDDKRAADMYEDALAGTLSESDLAVHDLHMVGTYRRNASTGFQRFAFYPEGLSGPETLVEY